MMGGCWEDAGRTLGKCWEDDGRMLGGCLEDAGRMMGGNNNNHIQFGAYQLGEYSDCVSIGTGI